MPHSNARHRKVAVLTLQGFQRLQAAIAETIHWNPCTKSCSLERLSELTGLSTHTLSKVHARQSNVDFRTLVRYFSSFGLSLQTSDYISPIWADETLVPVVELPFNGSQLKEPRSSKTIFSWGIAPNVSQFYGRSADLDTLHHWVLDQRCRLISLIGLGGIGKTWLATKLAEQIQNLFQAVIWRSLRPTPHRLSFNDLLDDLIRHLTFQPEAHLPEMTGAKIQLLIDCLHQTRCFLVLDNVESVLPEHTPQAAIGSAVPGTDHFDCEEFRELLRCLAQARHQSCVVLTSRAEPNIIQQLSGDNLPIRVFPLQGLQVAEAQQIFTAKGHFQGSPAEWSRLVAYYGGNPLILEILASTIKHIFAGSITAFFSQNTLIFDNIWGLLDQQLGCLSAPEQDVLKIITEQGICHSFADLRSHISPSISTAVLLAVLKSLQARSLIKTKNAQFSLQPLLRDYVRERFASSSGQSPHVGSR